MDENRDDGSDIRGLLSEAPTPPRSLDFTKIAMQARRRRRTAVAAVSCGCAVILAGAAISAVTLSPNHHKTISLPQPPRITRIPNMEWTPVDPAKVVPKFSRAQVLKAIRSDQLSRDFTTPQSSITATLATFTPNGVATIGSTGTLVPHAAPQLAWVVRIGHVSTRLIGGPFPLPGQKPRPTAMPKGTICSFYAIYNAQDGHRLVSQRYCPK